MRLFRLFGLMIGLGGCSETRKQAVPTPEDLLPAGAPALSTVPQEIEAEHGRLTGAPIEAAEPPLQLPEELEPKIVLLMPEDKLGARVEFEELSAHIDRISFVVRKLYTSGKISVAPMSVFIAVKPNRRVKVWAEGIETRLSPEDASLIKFHTEAVRAPAVSGAIVYAYAFPRIGTNLTGLPPMPSEWTAAARTAGRVLSLPDGVLAKVWPN